MNKFNDTLSKMEDKEIDEMANDFIFTAYEMGLIEAEMSEEGKREYEKWKKKKALED